MLNHEIEEGKLVIRLDLWGAEQDKCHCCGHVMKTRSVLYNPDQLRLLGMLIRDYAPTAQTDGEIIARIAGGIQQSKRSLPF